MGSTLSHVVGMHTGEGCIPGTSHCAWNSIGAGALNIPTPNVWYSIFSSEPFLLQYCSLCGDLFGPPLCGAIPFLVLVWPMTHWNRQHYSS